MKRQLILLFALLVVTSLGCSLSVAAPESDTGVTLNEQRPAVIFLAPQGDERFALGATVPLYAEARDLSTGVSRIEFYDNFDAVIQTITADNPAGVPRLVAQVDWQPPTAQRHFISARAFRADGTESALAEVSIVVEDLPGAPVADSAAPAAPPTATDDAETSGVAEPAQPAAAETEAQPAQSGASADTEPAQPADLATEQAAPPPDLSGTVLQGTVTVEALNVRTGPQVTAAIAASPLRFGDTIELVARSAEGVWYATPLSDQAFGWVFGSSLDVEGDPETLPVAE